MKAISDDFDWIYTFDISEVQGFFENTKVKISTVGFMILIFQSLMLWELVYVQYSVVCGVLVGTACFWFYTTPVNCGIVEFWKKNIPALCLVWLAFLVRSEMLLLTTPFLAATGIIHWTESAKIEKVNYRGIDKKKNWKYNGIWLKLIYISRSNCIPVI